MNKTLLLAAIYNVLWGAWVVLFPNHIFEWSGLELPNYPEIWQCVGMIVGVYGIGYGIAATNIVRHWPIVLVGFLGKIFGPLGFAWAIANNRFNEKFAIVLVFNDFIWWIPFFLILRHVWKNSRT